MTTITTKKKIKATPSKKITIASSDENIDNSTIIAEKNLSKKTYIKYFNYPIKNSLASQKVWEMNLKFGNTPKEQCDNFIASDKNLKFDCTKSGNDFKYSVYDTTAVHTNFNNKFSLKEQALEFIKNNPCEDLHLFAEDKYKVNTKIFIVATKKEIYEKSLEKKYSLYEHYLSKQKVRLIFDVDIDLTKCVIPDNFNKDNYFDNTINRIIERSNIEISKYTNMIPEIIILTANTDIKKSCHIIYKNIVFEDIYVMKYFVNDFKNDIVNCHVDYSIYADRCMRLLWNCKYGKNNFLTKYKLINYNETNNEILFYNSMIIPQNDRYVLINYKIKNTEIVNVNKEIINKNDKMVIKENFLNLDVPRDFIIELLNILSYIRLHDYVTWIQVVDVCRNYGFYDEIINISKKVSKKFDGKTMEIIDKIFDTSIPLHHLTKENIYKWCIIDNKNKFYEIVKKYNIVINFSDLYNKKEVDFLFNENKQNSSNEIKLDVPNKIEENKSNIVQHDEIKLDISNKIENKIQQVKTPDEEEIEIFINSLKANNKSNTRKLIEITEINKYCELLNENRFKSNMDFINIGIMIKNSNMYAFDCWYCIHKKFNKSNIKIDMSTFFDSWINFKVYGVDKSFDYLKVCAKKDSPELYYKLNPNEPVDFRLFSSIKIEKDYLLDRNEKLLDKKSEVSKHVCEWYLEKIYKTLCIYAQYGVGKTCLVGNVIVEFKPKKILILSYRQTLTYELKGNFRDLGVTSYLDKPYNVDRIICQIDSVIKVLSDSDAFADEFVIKVYDLVVIDESESVINHLFSNLITNKRDVFDFIRGILTVSKKILVLDGDFGNRSYEFIKELGNNLILENISTKVGKKFIFMDDKDDFEEKIDKDLLNGKNIVIVSMSASEITKYMEKYEKKYKCILHTSFTSDKVKKELENVNKLWKKFQLIMYSPNIEAGVSFVEEHIDNMYVILCKNTISQRALLQMMWRCRNIKNNDVFVYTNGMPFIEKCYPYTYNQTKLYTHSVYNEAKKLVIEQKFVGDQEITFARYEEDLFTKMNIYHEMEELNKHPFYFIPILLQLLKNKGCTYEYIPKKNKVDVKKEKKDNSFKYKKIVEAADVDINEYNILHEKQINNEAETEDKYKIAKYYYKKCWKVEIINAEFMEKFYMKTNNLFNLRYLTKELRQKNNSVLDEIDEDNFNEKILEELDIVNEDNNLNNDDGEINNEDGEINNDKQVIVNDQKNNDKIDEKKIFEKNNNHIVSTKNQYNIIYEKGKKNKMKNIIVDLLNRLGYENVFSKKKIKKEDFLKNIEDVMKNSLLIKNKKDNYPLFRLNKNCDYKFYEKKDNVNNLRIIDNKIIRLFLCFINRIFNNYEFCIKFTKTTKSTRNIKKNIVSYMIEFNNNINVYL